MRTLESSFKSATELFVVPKSNPTASGLSFIVGIESIISQLGEPCRICQYGKA
jgi:hypothetical protein